MKLLKTVLTLICVLGKAVTGSGVEQTPSLPDARPILTVSGATGAKANS